MTFLREDNTTTNCTTHADLFPMEGRKHKWGWINPESNLRVCMTCGREGKLLPRTKIKQEDVTGSNKAVHRNEKAL